MHAALSGINHVIIGVRDLEAARLRFGRLGFNSTPRGRHVGWGTANYCIMLERDYVELLGIVDPSQFTNNLDSLLAARGEGLTTVVLRTDDPEQTHAAWARAGLSPKPPAALGRRLETPEGAVELRFRNVMPEAGKLGGLGLFACQHLTPGPMRRPSWLAHPNGAVAIRSCTVVADAPAPVAEGLGRAVDAAALTWTDKVVAAHVGAGTIIVAPPEDAALMHPQADVPASAPEPRPHVLTVAVADRGRAARFLALQGVAFREAPNGDLCVPPGEACGAAIELVAA